MIADELIDSLSAQQLRQALRATQELAARHAREVAFKQVTIDKLTHEMAVLKRLKFAAKSEAFSAEQKSLLEETLDTDLAALAAEIEAQRPAPPGSEDKQQARREKLPAHLPRREIRHEPEDTTCGCGQAMKRIGEDVAEKLDYQPGVFTVERHVRGKWVCALLRDAGPGAGGAAQSSTRASRLPACWRRCWWPSTSTICRCTGKRPSSSVPVWPIARSTLAQWVGAVRRAAAAAGRCARSRDAQAPRAACRRDAGGDAQAGPGQDAPGVPVELLHDELRPDAVLSCSTLPTAAAASMCASSSG